MAAAEFYGSFWHWFWTLVCAVPILILIAGSIWASGTHWDTTFDDRTFDDEEE